MIVCRWIVGVVLIGACGSAKSPPVRTATTPAPPPTAAPAPPKAPLTEAPPAEESPPEATPPAALASEEAESTAPLRGVPSAISRDSRTRMEQLNAVDFFALGGVGIAGAPNPGETITVELVQQRDAAEAFSWLAAHGSPVARLYAYWALQRIEPARARGFAATLEADPTEIETMSGCFASRATIGDVARSLTQAASGRTTPL